MLSATLTSTFLICMPFIFIFALLYWLEPLLQCEIEAVRADF